MCIKFSTTVLSNSAAKSADIWWHLISPHLHSELNAFFFHQFTICVAQLLVRNPAHSSKLVIAKRGSKSVQKSYCWVRIFEWMVPYFARLHLIHNFWFGWLGMFHDFIIDCMILNTTTLWDHHQFGFFQNKLVRPHLRSSIFREYFSINNNQCLECLTFNAEILI
jgi:hypothetical protein